MALPAKLLGFERLRFPAQDGVFSKSAIKGVYNHDLLYFSFLQTLSFFSSLHRIEVCRLCPAGLPPLTSYPGIWPPIELESSSLPAFVCFNRT